MLKKFLAVSVAAAMIATSSLGCFAENVQHQTTQDEIVINGKTITADELERLLNQDGVKVVYEADNLDEIIQNEGIVEADSQSQTRNPVAIIYFIPGLGEVALLATGAVVVAGVTYYAGSWVYEQVMNWVKSH